jgi:hypothetical protein
MLGTVKVETRRKKDSRVRDNEVKAPALLALQSRLKKARLELKR